MQVEKLKRRDPTDLFPWDLVFLIFPWDPVFSVFPWDVVFLVFPWDVTLLVCGKCQNNINIIKKINVTKASVNGF